MRLKKEDVYINLRGKSKEELTDLYNFLESVGEKQYDTLERFLNTNTKGWKFYLFGRLNQWTHSSSSTKTEVTIDQLKEILKPNLQTQLENAKKEVERIEKLIEEENKPKAGDWCIFWDNDKSNLCISKLWYICHNTAEYHSPESHYKNCEKITNPELIKLLEDESK